jgi:uncharacterized protein
MTVGAVVRDERTAAFFDGTAAGQFLLRRCARCQAWLTPLAVQCGPCGSATLTWAPAAGGAKVVSWAVPHTRPDADGRTETTVIAVVELDEGPWWWTQIADAAPDAVTAGARLQVDFQRASDESEYVPVFRLT